MLELRGGVAVLELQAGVAGWSCRLELRVSATTRRQDRRSRGEGPAAIKVKIKRHLNYKSSTAKWLASLAQQAPEFLRRFIQTASYYASRAPGFLCTERRAQRRLTY